MANKFDHVPDLVLMAMNRSGELNKFRLALAKKNVVIQFIVHPETGQLGLRVPSDMVKQAQKVAESDPEFEVEILTIN